MSAPRCPGCSRRLTAAGLPAEHEPGCATAAAWGEDLLCAARAALVLYPEPWHKMAKSLVVSGHHCVLRGEPVAAALAALLDPAFVIALVEGVRGSVPAPPPVRCCAAFEESRGCCSADESHDVRHPRQDHDGDGPCAGCTEGE